MIVSVLVTLYDTYVVYIMLSVNIYTLCGKILYFLEKMERDFIYFMIEGFFKELFAC